MDQKFLSLVPLRGVNEIVTAEPGQAAEIVDMHWDPIGLWRSVGGAAKINEIGEGGSTAMGEILWMKWYRPSARRERYLLIEEATSDTESRLIWMDMSTRDIEVIQTGRLRSIPPDEGISTFEHNGWIYILDGRNEPVRWHPDRPVSTVGFQSCSAPEVTAGDDESGINVVDLCGVTDWVGPTLEYAQQRGLGNRVAGERWEYGWACCWINELGQLSPVSSRTFASGATRQSSGMSDTDDYRRGAIVQMHQAPNGTVGQLLLRTKRMSDTEPGLPDLYLHTTIFHGGTCDIVDFRPDSELSTIFDLDSVGPFPRGARVGAIWQQTLFVATSEPGAVYYSHPGKIEQFPDINVLPLGVPEAGTITSLHTIAQAVVVFCENGVFLIKGNPSEGFRIQLLVIGKGSVCGRAVVDVPALGLAFLDRTGPQVLLGALENQGQPTQVVPLGQVISKTWGERINLDALSLARGLYDPHHREVWWHLPEKGSQIQTFGVVYHLEVGSFSFRETWPIGAFDYDQGHVWFGSNTTAGNNDGIYQISDAYETKAGVALSSSYTTGWLVDTHRSILGTVRPQLMATGADTFLLDYRFDRSLVWTVASDNGVDLLPTERRLDRWGTAVWGSGVWGDYAPTRIPVDCRNNSGLEHQVRIRSGRMRLVAVDAGAAPARGATNIPFRRSR